MKEERTGIDLRMKPRGQVKVKLHLALSMVKITIPKEMMSNTKHWEKF
jgi:hypothetical protein